MKRPLSANFCIMARTVMSYPHCPSMLDRRAFYLATRLRTTASTRDTPECDIVVITHLGHLRDKSQCRKPQYGRKRRFRLVLRRSIRREQCFAQYQPTKTSSSSLSDRQPHAQQRQRQFFDYKTIAHLSECIQLLKEDASSSGRICVENFSSSTTLTACPLRPFATHLGEPHTPTLGACNLSAVHCASVGGYLRDDLRKRKQNRIDRSPHRAGLSRI